MIQAENMKNFVGLIVENVEANFWLDRNEV